MRRLREKREIISKKVERDRREIAENGREKTEERKKGEFREKRQGWKKAIVMTEKEERKERREREREYMERKLGSKD